MSDQTILRVTFVSESAANQNTFGWYNSSTGVGGVLFANVDSQGSGALTPGVSYVDFAVNTADLGKIQFFLIPDGAAQGRNAADDLSGAIKVIKLSDGTWAVADVDANGNVIYVAGKPDLLTGVGVNALFTETSKNAGGVDYASSVAGSAQTAAKLAGDTADGATGTIAWEDTAATRKSNGTYTAPGDADYNDAVFQVSIVQKPVANADAITINEDAGATAINVLANDTNPAGGTLRVTAVNTQGILGTVSIAADGHNITYSQGSAFQSLRAGQTATETFTYTVTNSAGVSSTATTTVTILGANDAAVIGAASATDVTEDSRNPTLKITGTIAISDVDQGEASFKTTVTPAAGNLGTLTLSANGSYTYSIANSAVQYLGAGEDRVEKFTVSALDGATKIISFTVHGTNDSAVIGTPTATTVTEDSSTPTLSVSGTISISDADQNQAKFQAGTFSGTGNLGTLTLTENGGYSYSVNNSAIQYLGKGDTKVETFTVTSVDGTAKQVSFVIKGVNDAAVIGTPTVHDVYDNPSALVLTASGTIGITDADQGEAAFKPSIGAAAGNLGFLLLASDGSYVYVVAQSAAHNLAPGATKVDTFTVTAVDGTATQVTFTVHGPAGGNHAPTIGNPTFADVTEDGPQLIGSNLIAEGNISISDPDAGQSSFKTDVAWAAGNLGTLTLDANGHYVYSVANSAVQYLGAGQSKVDTFTIKSEDGTTKSVDFTIHGANDGATITSSSSEDTDVIEAGGIANASAGDAHAGGQLTVQDLDSGQNHFLTPASLVGTYGDFTFNSASGAWSYTLDQSKSESLVAGQHVTDKLTVTSADGSAVRDIVVNITGANDAAVITSSSNEDRAVTEAGGVANALAGDPSASGQLTVHDVDTGQDHFVSPASLAGTYGDFTFNATSGNWTYTLDQGKSNSLAGGQNVTDTLTVASTDGTTHDIVVNIAGANDAPAQAAFTKAGAALLEGSATGTVVGTALASDPDSSDSLTYSLVGENGAAYAGPLSINAQTGVVTVGGDIDFETTDGLLTAVIRTTDQGGLFSDKLISVVVEDQAEFNASAIEGYIANATIFVDDDGSGDLSAGDFVTHSDSVGNFKITGIHTGAIYLQGGSGAFDTATGLQFNGTLRAAPGSTVLSPLTTLIAAIADQNGGNYTTAKALVAAAFDVPVGVELNTFDPLAAAVSDNPVDQALGAKLFAAGVQLYNVIVQGAALITGAGGTTQSAANAMLDAIVEQVSAGTLDLSNEDNLTAVINVAAGNAGADVGAVAAGAATVMAASNTLIGDAVAGGQLSGTDLLQSIAGTATVAQGAAAQALNAAGSSGDASGAVNNFTDESLQAAVDTATSNVDTNAMLGPAGNNVLTGTSGADTLDGAGGDDVLHGEGGKDTLIGGSGNDLLDGGQGFDRAVYSDATGGITANLAAGTVSGPGVGADTLVDVESVVGSDYADTFDATGFTGDAHIPGTPVGYNEFEGRGGNDTIISATNSQGAQLTRVSYVGATAAVTVDLQAGTADGDASVGHDTLVGSGFNSVWGSAFDDTIRGSNNPMFTAEVYSGGAGNDFIDGRGGFDRVDYNANPSTTTGIAVNMAAGTVSGDATVGTDTLRGIEAIRGTNFVDTYVATGFGSGSTNAGSSGTFNEFTGNGGDDIITGNGATRLGFNNATAGVTVDFVTGIATGDSSVGTDHFTGVNAVQASMFDDTLRGGATNDTFTGLAGNDFIDGRGGFDVASFNNIFFTTGSITVNMAAGIVTGDASNGTDTLRSIEGVQGTNFADTYDATGYGVAGALNIGNNQTYNQFEGLGGDDSITGNGNTRLLFNNATGGVTINLAAGTATGDASTGHDTFTGVNSALGSNFADIFDATGFFGPSGTSFQGQGGDDQIIGSGFTQIQFNNATGGVTINLAAGTANGDASVGHDTFTGVNNAIGSNFSDVYDATGFAGGFNWFQGNAGNDTITGNGSTQINYGSATSGVTVNLAAGTADGDASVGHDTIVGGVTNVFASNFNDTIIGSASNDSLSGSGGNDTLDGRGGNDSLNGGAGADTFVYASGGGFDYIQDFLHGTDKIDLSGVYGVYNLSDVQSRAVWDGFNSVITFGPGDTLTLQGVNFNILTASDFLFGTPAAAIVGDDNANNLTGTAAAESISGLGGNDRLQGLGGSDFLDGGLGFDRAIYSDATGGVSVNLTAGTATGPGVGTDTLVNIEGAVGSDFADTFNATGFTGNSGIIGSAIGQAEFEGRGGDDVIIGSVNISGQVLGRVSYVSATAGVTVDLAAGTADGNVSVGHDTFSFVNTIFGSAYADTMLGSNNPNGTYEQYDARGGDDFIDGRGGYDFAVYNNDATTLSGITVNLAAGTVTGDASVGTDTLRSVEAVRGTNFVDTYNAVGFSGTSTNAGSSGTFNNFEGMGGDDIVTGNGNTRIQYTLASDGVTVDLTTGTSHGTAAGDVAHVGTDHFTGVNAVMGSLFGDVITGTNANETFMGLAGNDQIDGGGGFDTAQYSNLTFVTGGITADMASGTVTGDATTGTDQLRQIEGIQGTIFADTYVATGFGMPGALNVGNSGLGNNFEGMGGDDGITGNGFTRLIYNNATGGVTVKMAAGTVTGDASVGHDSFTGVLAVNGSNFADIFDATGFVGQSQFQGLAGDDQIIGNGSTQIQYGNATTSGVTVNMTAGTVTGDGSVGHDTFSGVNAVVGSNFDDVYDATGFNGIGGTFNNFLGGGGNDTIIGNGNTQITYGNPTGGVIVNLAAGTVDGDASVGHDTIIGGVKTVQGTLFNDTITGGGGDDTLFGNGGNDRLDGGAGNDYLGGGVGADTFVYATGNGADFVQDFFQFDGDKIDLTGVNGVFSLADVQAHATQNGNNTVLDFGGGDTLTLQNVTFANLVAGDFVFGTPIQGDGLANTLPGTAHNDTILGLGGNDKLQGLGGYDLLDGGAGFDRALYTDATGGITVNLAAGTVSGAGVGSDTLVGIESIVGSNYADTYNATGFTGDSGIPGAAVGLNEFEGGAGNDLITGSANASAQILTRISYVSATSGVTVDLAAGTADGDASVGHDTFTSVNAIIGSTHADTLLGTNNAGGTYEQFDARAGDDFIDGRGGYDFASYNQDSTTLSGITVNLAAGTVTGDASVGSDTLRGVEGVRGTNYIDTYNAVGFSGASTNAGSLGTFNNFEGMGGNDQITGNGNTRLQFTQALDGVTVDIAAGTSQGTAAGDVAQVGTDNFTGVNAVLGSLFADNLSGSGANEQFQGLAGNDTIDGRGGFDTAQYSNLTYVTGGISVDMASGTVTGDASTGTDTLRSIEGVSGTIFADTYVATGYGQAGALNVGNNQTFNQFEGQGGDDLITGNGNTRLLYTNATGGVTISMAAGSVTGDASVGHDTFTSVNSVNGSNFGDIYDATGFVGFNGFQGLGGDDVITGNGVTQLFFNNATGGVTVDISTGTVSGDASVGHDTFTGVNNVVGSGFGDTLKGGNGADVFTGGGGADTFIYVSGGGADFIGDFSHGQTDKIDLSGVTGIYSLADIQAIALQQGPNTFINFGNGDSLTLQNVTLANLTASDFIFSQGVHLVGDADPNTLTGTAFSDSLSGLGGNDILFGLGGNDQLDGGQGFDRADYGDATGGISVNLVAGSATGPGVGVDTLVNVEGILGSNYADTFNAAGYTGSTGYPGFAAGQNEFEGRGGDDVVIGDINALGQVVTRLSYLGATSAVTVDIAAGTANGDASVGHDTFSNVSTIWGSAYNDTIYGSDNANFTYETYEGRGGDDYIDGRGGYDQVTYNNDPATTSGIYVHLAAGTVNGDASVGTDTLRAVEAARGTNFADTFDATGFGQAGAVNVGSSGTFNDFAGAGGNDTIIGNGATRLNYQVAASSVSVDLETSVIGTTNSVTVGGSATGATEGTDTFTGVNAVQGSTFSDTLLGSSFNNNITGLGGDDYIDGRGGFDVAIYNSLSTVTGGVTVDMAAGTATGDASIGNDTLRSIEGVQGTGYADVYVATGYGQIGAANIGNNGFYNQFEGLGGDDQITGNGSTRLIYGNATGGVSISLLAGTASGNASVGTDTFTGVNGAVGSNYADTFDASGVGGFTAFQGQGGDDTIIGNGFTQILFSNANTGVTINLAAGTANGDGSTGHDTFSGVNNVVGGNGNDIFDATGFVGTNFFTGGAGNDTITGNGFTALQFGGATSAVSVNLATGTVDGDGSVGHDTIIGGVTTVQGSNFNDTIIGSASGDQLFGGGGNDVINGGAGNDFLSGDFGADTFFYANGGGADIIGDFQQGQTDKIDLTGVAGVSNLAQLQALATQMGPNTVFDFGNGDTLTLNNVTLSNLSAADFVFGQGVTLTGDAGPNTLTGTPYADTLNGLDGNDKLYGLGGNDQLNGGQGFDRADYSGATGGVTAILASGSVTGPGVGTDTLIDVEGIVGSDYADTFSAAGFAGDTGIPGTNPGFNEFEGRGGDDTITSGTNSLGAPLTRISYAHASGNVTVDFNLHAATGDASVGTDTLVGSGFGGVVGSAGADQLLGSTNGAGTVEIFEGRAGNDFIDGRLGFDRADYALDPAAVGGINVQLASGIVTGDAATVGTDTLRSIESVRGSNATDTFNATNFGAGSTNAGSNGTFNEFIGMGGDDHITGNGNTRVSFTNATGAVTVDLQTGGTPGTGSATGDASTGTDDFSGVNAVMATMFGDTIYGSNNTLATETFTGLAGNDFIDGRGGFDVISYNNIYFSTGPVTIDFKLGTATGDASVGTDTFRGIEGAQGTTFNDTFTATGFGAPGLNATTNNVGNNGNFNQFEGLAGNDTITGNGNTRIIYSSAVDAVTVNLQAGTASGGSSIGTDTYVGVNSATGSNQADTFNAAGFTGVTSAGSFGTFNLFEGLLGDDDITGNGNTRVSYSQVSGGIGVSVNLATGVVSGAAGADIIRGGVNSVQGSNFNDTLTGDANDEFFFGGGGIDTINAGGGNDGIIGQGGSDQIDGGAGTDMVTFTGAQGQYTVTTSGTTVVQNNSGNGDGIDTLSNVEVLQFSDYIVMLSSGSSGNPIDISTQQQITGNATVMGTGGDDYLRVGSNIFGHAIDLGGGTADTVLLNGSFFGNGFTLNLTGVEYVTGSSNGEFVNLTKAANGLVVDLGDGIDNLTLAGGANTISLAGVENVAGTDFGPSPGVNDVLNLSSTVTGVNISLGNGDNTMNLAAGANSFTNIFDVNHVNGTASNDTLTVTGSIGAQNGVTINLGDGEDTIVINGNSVAFAAVDVEHVNGNEGNNFVNFTNNIDGIAVDLGGGDDFVVLANGVNSLSVAGVENLQGSDFTGNLNPSDDTITLLNNVSGLSVNMGEGTANVLNLHEGSNTFNNFWNVNLLNGSASDDTLTVTGSPANVIDLGDGNDTLNMNGNVYDITITNVETINLAANFDRITIGNTSGNTTVTAGAGADEIYASGGHDNFRFTAIGDSAAGAADTVHNFDATNDSFTFSGITLGGGHIEFIDNGGALLSNGQASAHLVGPGNDLLQIDTNGDGTSDMDVSMQNLTNPLHNGNFLT